MVCQAFCGLSIVQSFTAELMVPVFGANRAEVATVPVGVTMLICTLVVTVLIERVGRRPLLLVSSMGMAASSFGLGWYFSTTAAAASSAADSSRSGSESNETMDVNDTLGFASIICFVAFFNLGLGPIPWILCPELFPSALKGSGTSGVTLVLMLCWWLTLQFFDTVRAAVGKAHKHTSRSPCWLQLLSALCLLHSV